jgi:hypothetical protein
MIYITLKKGIYHLVSDLISWFMGLDIDRRLPAIRLITLPGIAKARLNLLIVFF